ncbi:glycoside hydrolase family 15 protein [Nonomuraea turcica]|uniref:glycoside hydrolase family 15 protein n=1 Tax=Nonomuraea sp. G32 TaxID=3067274 RepID=UPI00273BB942|nr:glycoside hydrolase family 15 protein [Nonomuraea sp. G32]MDP4502639.1 glycoside hydrolase family 15 protein [Nonomuraea sp. G32]
MQAFGTSGPIATWRATAEKLRRLILDQSWDEEAQCLSEATTAAIAERLSAGDGLHYRYLHDHSPDGLPGAEGAFVLCSFWLVDNLILHSHMGRAEELNASLCARANPVGLLPEQIDPATGAFMGNFPQAFSHIGIIASGVNLVRVKAGMTA